MPIVQTTRLKTHYELHGKGEPLLLIRGLGSTCEGFAAQVEGLRAHFQVMRSTIAASAGPNNLNSLSQSRIWLTTPWAAAMRWNRERRLFGVSLGGMIAQESCCVPSEGEAACAGLHARRSANCLSLARMGGAVV